MGFGRFLILLPLAGGGREQRARLVGRVRTHDVGDDAGEVYALRGRRERVDELRGSGGRRPDALLEYGARLGRAHAEEARGRGGHRGPRGVGVGRLGARVVRVVVGVRAGAGVASGGGAEAGGAAGAAEAAGREGVVVVCRGEGRAREGQVHVFAGEEGRARGEAFAREGPVAPVLHAAADDEEDCEADDEDEDSGDG